MGARQHLNQWYFGACFFVAGIIGLANQSWLVFVAALIVLIALFVIGGKIRLSPQRPARSRGKRR